MITTRPTLRTLWTTAAVVALAGATLLGCSGDDENGGGVSSSSTTRSASSTSGRQDTSGGDPDAPASPLVAAARFAGQQVPGTTVVTVETERGGTAWEVHLVSADGTEHEVVVSADGTTVIAGPVTEDDDAEDRAQHRSEVAADRIGYARAARIVLDAVPEGTVTELDLDTDRGRVVWEADVAAADGVPRDVKVDARTGAVVANRVDT